MKQFYFLTIIFLFQISYAQQMPIGFSQGYDQFEVFGNSGFSFNTDPDQPSNAVGQFFNDGSDVWQGFYIDLTQPIILSDEQQLTLNFFQYDPNGHSILLKLENGSGADVEVIQSASGSGWTNDIVFDFSNATISGTSNTTNATGTYTRLVIFIDGGTNTPGTYLIDNINNGSEFVNPNELDEVYTDLVWSDEFSNQGVVDPTNWFHQTQVIIPGVGWANGEEQHYTNRIDNSFIDANGFLNIVAKKETFLDQSLEKEYTSARLNSKFAFTYGRVDVRAKLPFGDGTWPAIWMLGKNVNEDGAYWDNQGFGTTNWPLCGEIDIMEHGLGATNHVSSALHTSCAGCSGATMNYQPYILNDVANEFHVYSVNWSPNQITFLVDGIGFYTYNPAVKDDSTWPFYEDQYVLLNVAMGGIAGPIDPNFNQSSMLIDYVRVYQNVLSDDEFYANKFKVSPNPTSDYIKISTEEVITTIELYDIMGQLILRNYKNVKRIDVKNLTTGLYLLKINLENRSITKKILID